MKFIANENFPLSSIKILRKAGYNVISVTEETPGTKDLYILQRAHNENLIIFTFDRDYGELVYRNKSSLPCGVIYLRFVPSFPEEPAEILLEILNDEIVSIEGKFTVVERGRLRQRKLI